MFTERLRKRVPLSAAELAFLRSLEQRNVRLRRHQMLVRAGEPALEAFVVKSGWAMSFTRFPDGSRQVRRLHFPGDLIAMPSIAMRHHAEDVEAISDLIVSPFGKHALAEIFDHPRIAALMYLFAQAERVSAGDRLACLGRTDAKGRMAYLLIDILHHLRDADPSVRCSFAMHLTREQMADVTGMTPVHASRMWSELLADGLIRCDDGQVTILDEDRLTAMAGYIDRQRDLDFPWVGMIDRLSRTSPSAA